MKVLWFDLLLKKEFDFVNLSENSWHLELGVDTFSPQVSLQFIEGARSDLATTISYIIIKGENYIDLCVDARQYRPIPSGGRTTPPPTPDPPTSNYRVPPAHRFHKYKLRLLYFRMQKLYSIIFIKKQQKKQPINDPPPLQSTLGTDLQYMNTKF